MVELEEIAAIPHHVITPRHAKPMIGVYQDTLVGSYRLTQPGIQFTLKEYMNLMMWNKRFDGTIQDSRCLVPFFHPLTSKWETNHLIQKKTTKRTW
jgi:DNA-directed RNA polymerase beta' subunit